jgi:uncharacterized protein YdhG (YjbR/CyaY superfamily)
MKAAVKPASVDEYLATLSADKRGALEKLRRAIRFAAPGAVECISYAMPAFRLNGKLIGCYFAAKNHCSFFPGSQPLAVCKKELAKYDTSKGTLRFSPGKPLPVALVKKLVKARIAQHLKKTKTRRKKS